MFVSFRLLLLNVIFDHLTALHHESNSFEFGDIGDGISGDRDEVAARQAQAERVLWLRAVGEAFPPAAEAARTRLRQQTLALLRAEVAAQAQRLSSGSPAEATAARQVLEALVSLPVLAGVRDSAALANLPEGERQTWQAFWEEVEGLLREGICP